MDRFRYKSRKRWGFIIQNRSIGYLVLILFISFSQGYAQETVRPQIQKIEIHGNRGIDKSQLTLAMGIAARSILPDSWPQESLQKLLTFYYQQGFYFCRVDSFQTRFSIDTSRVDLDIWLTEGEPLHVDSFVVKLTHPPFPNDIRDHLMTKPGRLFSSQLLEADVQFLLSLLENEGYPLARLDIDSFHVHHSEEKAAVDIALVVNQGPLVRIDSINVKGNKLTKRNVVLREIRLQRGDIFQLDKIEEGRANLQRLGYFEQVDDPQIHFHGDQADITFQIKEGNANTMDGVLGYNPPKDKRENGYVTGRLEFTFRNLLGTGRFLDAYWEKKDRYSQAMRLGYEEPWFLGWPVHLGGTFQQVVRDTTYLERETHFSIRYTPWTVLSLQAKAGVSEVLPDSAGTVLHQLPQSKSWFLTGALDYNTLDNPINPRRGLRYQTAITLGRKKNMRTEYLPEDTIIRKKVNTRKIHVMAEMAFPLLRKQVLYLKANGHEIQTGDKILPISEQIRFGGSRTVRGYKEDAFRAALAAWSNLEYRYLIGRSSRVFLFVDSCVYQRKETDSGKIRRFKVGYGFGIRLRTRLGLMGVDYGLGEGDRLMQGKIHVGLMNRF